MLLAGCDREDGGCDGLHQGGVAGTTMQEGKEAAGTKAVSGVLIGTVNVRVVKRKVLSPSFFEDMVPGPIMSISLFPFQGRKKKKRMIV